MKVDGKKIGFALAWMIASTVPMAVADDSSPTTRRDAQAAWQSEGLQRIGVPGLDVAYLRPGANLHGYHSLLIKPISVSFQKNWERNAGIPVGTRLRPRDTDRIRKDMADVVGAQLKREFETGGWRLVEAPGAGVLEIDVRIVDLYLNAPDLPTPGITKSYTRTFGELTLAADLRDASSGNVVMRTLDRIVGRDRIQLERTTRVENAHDVGIATAGWARVLRRQFELARVAGDGSNSRP